MRFNTNTSISDQDKGFVGFWKVWNLQFWAKMPPNTKPRGRLNVTPMNRRASKKNIGKNDLNLVLSLFLLVLVKAAVIEYRK